MTTDIKDYDVYPLFSIPVYKSSEEIDEKLRQKIKQEEVYRTKYDDGYLSINTRLLNKECLKELKDKIQSQIEHYVHSVLNVETGVEFYITNSWITVHEKGDYAAQHNHVNSLFSGTYYIDAPDDDESALYFHTKNKNTIFPTSVSPTINEWNIFNSGSYYFKPKTGDLFIFPSHLEHSVDRSTSESKRYCLAFNVFVKGTLRDHEMEFPINELKLT